MLTYLIKRIILIIPVILLITLLIFILGEFIPGDSVLFKLPNHEAVLKSSLDPDKVEQSYIDLRKKYHVDLPVFYFSFHTLAEPDSLYLIYPVKHRSYLKKMIFEYGNWPAIYHYYKLSCELREVNLEIFKDKNLSNKLTALFEETYKENIEEIISSLERLAIANPNWQTKLDELKKSYKNLDNNRQYYKNFIPSIHFHGSQNKYHQWLTGIFKKDGDRSVYDGRKVRKRIREALSNTLIISTITIFSTFIISIILGIFLSKTKNRLKRLILTVMFGLDAIPLFWIALICITFFANSEYWQLFPAFGLEEDQWLRYSFLPIFCMVLTGIPYITRQVQAAMEEIYKQEYITTAKAKGASPWKIVKSHALKNGLLPIITLFIAYLPVIVSGTLVIEYIFSIPGIGKLMVDSVFLRDYPIILGIVVLISFVKIIANIVGDVGYYFADPRIRY